jgi:hypothetical protein
LSLVAVTEVAGQTRRPRQDRGRDTPQAVRTISLHWDGVPLQDAVARLAETLDRPFFVDRRVDPSQRVSLSLNDATTEQVLNRVADELSLGVSELDGLVYLGPRQTAEQLRTLSALRRAEARHMPSDEQRVLRQRNRLSWPRLSEPRGLVEGVVEAQGWMVQGGELIPHDLWPAGELPPMSLSDQLTLLLAGFDLTFEPVAGERAVSIRPISEPVAVRKEYRWPIDSSHQQNLAQLQQQLPDATLSMEGDQLVVVGRVEDHERLLELLGRRPSRSQPSASVRPGERRYTLRVDNQPVDAVLRQLGRQLGWDVQFDEQAIQAAGRSAGQRVSFSVQDVSVDELLDALLKPAGLTYRRDDQRLTVVPR